MSPPYKGVCDNDMDGKIVRSRGFLQGRLIAASTRTVAVCAAGGYSPPASYPFGVLFYACVAEGLRRRKPAKISMAATVKKSAII